MIAERTFGSWVENREQKQILDMAYDYGLCFEPYGEDEVLFYYHGFSPEMFSFTLPKNPKAASIRSLYCGSVLELAIDVDSLPPEQSENYKLFIHDTSLLAIQNKDIGQNKDLEQWQTQMHRNTILREVRWWFDDNNISFKEQYDEKSSAVFFQIRDSQKIYFETFSDAPAEDLAYYYPLCLEDGTFNVYIPPRLQYHPHGKPMPYRNYDMSYALITNPDYSRTQDFESPKRYRSRSTLMYFDPADQSLYTVKGSRMLQYTR